MILLSPGVFTRREFFPARRTCHPCSYRGVGPDFNTAPVISSGWICWLDFLSGSPGDRALGGYPNEGDRMRSKATPTSGVVWGLYIGFGDLTDILTGEAGQPRTAPHVQVRAVHLNRERHLTYASRGIARGLRVASVERTRFYECREKQTRLFNESEVPKHQIVDARDFPESAR